MIAPNSVHFRTLPHRSVVDAFVKNVAQNGPERGAVDERRDDAAEDAEQQRVDVEQAGDEHQRQEARHDEVLDRVDAEHLQRVELLADLARAEVGGDRGAGHAGEHDRGDEGRELADRGQHEEAAEAVQRAEEDEEVGGLQARRAVAEGDGRDQQREPAQPQREEELADELAAVGVRRTQGRQDRLPRQNHHVPDLFEQILRRKKRPVGDAANHLHLVVGTHERRTPLRVHRIGHSKQSAGPLTNPNRRVQKRHERADPCGTFRPPWRGRPCSHAVSPGSSPAQRRSRSRAAAAVRARTPTSPREPSRSTSSERASRPSSTSPSPSASSSPCATRATRPCPTSR